MSLEKSIHSGKEYRKPYRGAKAVDHSCRNHGSCPWCNRNRFIKLNRENIRLKQQLRDYES
jgi:hypothetical protein